MKRFLMLSACIIMLASCSEPKDEQSKAELFQKNLNKEFKSKDSSPLPPDAIKKFKKLDFFPISERFIIEADLVRTPDEKPFEMLTTTDRKPKYIKYGEATFKLSGKEHKVDLFQDLSLLDTKEYAKHLFLPFTDLTSGVTTYGGGRYIDLEIPNEDNGKLIINFNLAYNPYCVYNPKFSCPIPPEQNYISTEINAGIKDYKYE